MTPRRYALLALVPLGLAFAFVVAWAPWHSNFDVDSLTHYLQILSIADHGSGGFHNGAVTGNPELTPRWLFPVHGEAWGPYPVLGDYVLAPAAWLDGYRGILRAIWLLFAASCAVTYALTLRLTRRPGVAVAAAYSLALATSCGFWGTMTAPFLPTAAFGIASIDLVSRSFESPTRRRRLALALGAGVFASLAVGSHLVWTVAWAAVAGVCLVEGSPGTRLERALAYVAGSAPGLALMAWVNHVRFGTFSPFSYGPCGLEGCLDSTASNPQSGADFVAASLPYAPYVLVVAATCWFVRRSSVRVGMVVFVAVLAALVPETPASALFRNLARTLWAYLFDAGDLDFGYLRWSADPGTFSFMWRYGGPWAIRALFQCSPVLILALLPRGRGASASDRATLRVLLAACGGVLLIILMRANLPGPHAIAMAFLNQRYLVPALPALTVIAFVGVASLPFRAWHVAVATAACVFGAAILSRQANDNDLFRRQVTHWLPLGVALLLWVSSSGARGLARSSHRAAASHAAALLVAIAVGYGGAVTFGVDRVAARVVRGFQDERALELERCTPKRFILVGGRAMDESLALLDEKHIYFINPIMGPRDASNTRRLVLEALAPDNPAFLIDDEASIDNWQFHWPGLEFEEVAGCPRIRRIVPTGATPLP